MKLHSFREVAAIAEQGSIRAAAPGAGGVATGPHAHLAELEREVGGPLFERQARGMVAIALGQAFVRRAASSLNEVRRTQNEMEQLCGAATGTVTAGLSIAAHLPCRPPRSCRSAGVASTPSCTSSRAST